MPIGMIKIAIIKSIKRAITIILKDLDDVADNICDYTLKHRHCKQIQKIKQNRFFCNLLQ